jgi:hypothetical protein
MLVSSQKLNNINSSEIIPGKNPGSLTVSPEAQRLNDLYYHGGRRTTQALHSVAPTSLRVGDKLHKDDKLHEKCGVFGIYKFNQDAPQSNLGDIFKQTLVKAQERYLISLKRILFLKRLKKK